MGNPADLPDLPDQLDELDQLDDDALLNGGPVATSGEDTVGLTLEDLPF
jgi:hypothetical protein